MIRSSSVRSTGRRTRGATEMTTTTTRTARRTAAALVTAATLGVAGAVDSAVAAGGPDLVVTGVSTASGSLTTGSKVVFSATIRNAGTAATPAGVVHGVAFAVDGQVVSWSDTAVASLAPGASITVKASGGPQGAVWTATGGQHTVRAHVDDVNRVREGNETNNVLTRTVSVTSAQAAGMQAVTAVTARQRADAQQWRITHDRTLAVSWQAPAGQPAGTTYTVVEHPVSTDGGYCGPQADVVRTTTTATSVTLPQSTGRTCFGHGESWTSTFSVLATAPGGATARSARSGACTAFHNVNTSAQPAPVEVWRSECDGGATYSDDAMVSGNALARIDAGSTTGSGTHTADTGFTGGQTHTSSTGLGTVLDTSRWGWSAYSVPAPAGRHRVRLHLVEPTFSSAGQRVFGLSVNGTVVRERLDLAAEAGLNRVHVVEAFVETTGGGIEISSTRIVDNPIVAAIEVSPVL